MRYPPVTQLLAAKSRFPHFAANIKSQPSKTIGGKSSFRWNATNALSSRSSAIGGKISIPSFCRQDKIPAKQDHWWQNRIFAGMPPMRYPPAIQLLAAKSRFPHFAANIKSQPGVTPKSWTEKTAI